MAGNHMRYTSACNNDVSMLQATLLSIHHGQTFLNASLEQIWKHLSDAFQDREILTTTLGCAENGSAAGEIDIWVVLAAVQNAVPPSCAAVRCSRQRPGYAWTQ